MYTAYNFSWKSFPNTPISSLSWPIYLHTHWCTMPPQWSAPHRIVPTGELAAHGLSGDGNQSARRQTIVVHCDYDNILITKLDHFAFGTFEVQRFHPLKMPPPTATLKEPCWGGRPNTTCGSIRNITNASGTVYVTVESNNIWGELKWDWNHQNPSSILLAVVPKCC